MEENIVYFSLNEAKALKGASDLARIASMTDEEINQAALADPDSALPSKEELKQFKRATHLGGGVYGHKKISEEQARALVGETDWARLIAMTDNDIKLAAMADETAREFLPHELQQFKRKKLVPK